MHVNVTDTPIIPYNEDRYYIFGSNKAFVSVVGDVVGPVFPTMPINATSLLNLPMVCISFFHFMNILSCLSLYISHLTSLFILIFFLFRTVQNKLCSVLLLICILLF